LRLSRPRADSPCVLRCVREIGVPPEAAGRIHEDRFQQLIREARISDAHQMGRYSVQRPFTVVDETVGWARLLGAQGEVKVLADLDDEDPLWGAADRYLGYANSRLTSLRHWNSRRRALTTRRRSACCGPQPVRQTRYPCQRANALPEGLEAADFWPGSAKPAAR